MDCKLNLTISCTAFYVRGKYRDGFEASIQREVSPYVPDAWVAQEDTRIGYEISVTRYFYKPHLLPPLAEIRADIVALEKETEGLLKQIIGDFES